jgi:hypothetical protein
MSNENKGNALTPLYVVSFLITCLAIVAIATPCAISESGTLELSLSDSPSDASNVTGVYITVNEIQYHGNGSWENVEGFNGPATYNLIELVNGNTAFMGNLTLPSGMYSQIRFILAIPVESEGMPSNPGCYITFSDAADEPLFVPSASKTGFKATGTFDVPVNGTVSITTDFDVRRAITSYNSHYVLQPTFRLIVDNEAGTILGPGNERKRVRDDPRVCIFERKLFGCRG